MTEALSDDDITEIEQRLAATTPGPWYVRHLDDKDAMSLTAVSTTPDTGLGERWPDFDHAKIVAVTLVQEPRYADVDDERWDQKAAFNAHPPTDVPRVVAVIRRLRADG